MRLPQMERICPRTADFEIGRIEGGEPDLKTLIKKESRRRSKISSSTGSTTQNLMRFLRSLERVRQDVSTY